jgi:hypothetical protein
MIFFSPFARLEKPSYMPKTSQPDFFASMVTELITLLIPGAGPPPQTIARVFWTGVVMVCLLHGILEQILAHYSGYN